MLVDNLVFIHIPKTAGISISTWLSSYFNIINFGYHYSTNTIKNTYETFAVVRNPWDRIVSLWSFVKETNLSNIPNFDEFVKNLNLYKFNESTWFTFATPQKYWIQNGVTYLLKFETLEEDFKIIQNRLQCYEPLPIINTSKHEDYHKYYTQETWNIINKLFEEDIITFNYVDNLNIN